MSLKKILIVCHSFYPEICPRSFRATELANEFARQGHEVIVLVPLKGRDYSGFEKEYNVKIKDLGNLRFKEIKLNGKGLKLLFRRALRRMMQVLFEYPYIELMFKVASALKNEKGYDLLISIAVPHPIHWSVAKVWKKDQKIARTWVADCGDPYMLGRLDTFKKAFYFRYFEKSFCRKCNFISVPFEAMRVQFYPEFSKKIVVIPQGFDLSKITKYVKQPKNSKPTFIFAGSIIPGIRDLTLFLNYLVSLNIDFQFIVYTIQKEWFSYFNKQLNNKLSIYEYIDRESLIHEMSNADFLVNVDTILDTENNTEAVPSKLIDYALAGRPILNLNSGNLDKSKVDAFLSGDYSKARKIELEKYNITTITRQFLVLT